MTKTVALLPELKSCPFCDGPVHKRLLETVEACFHIGAPYCPVMSHRLMTIEQWNTRTQTDQQLREEVERLREVLDITRHELRRQHDGVDFERTKRCRGLIEQLDDALSSSSLTK